VRKAKVPISTEFFAWHEAPWHDPATLWPCSLLSDRIGFLPRRQARSRRDQMAGAVRDIEVRINTGAIPRLLANDLDAPAERIAEPLKKQGIPIPKQLLTVTEKPETPVTT
jgi:hypothetical protein